MGLDEAGRIARAAERVRRRSRVPLKLLLPTAVALGAGAAVAVGSIPGSDGTITACYNAATQSSDNPYGLLRIIDPAATTPPDYQFDAAPVNACGPDEKQITWNQQGPMGPTGPTGPAGGNGASASITGETTFDVESGHGSRVLLKLDGVSGSTTTKAQTGDIGLDKFAFGAEGTVGSASSGAGAGKVSVQTFEFVKQIDKTSPILFRDETNGTVISKAEVGIYHAANKGALTEVATYDLSHLVIKNITQKGSTETVLGVFSAVSSTVGTGQNKVSTGWNQVSNTGWDLTQTKTP
ncbi:MAG TPA: type VI secretion system tube protein Hcp [Solirubrobacteraceae bacterium]|jgi:type VI protein secretion system component Hcp|nr:type VI secretion system tube protein Hcp [Solirubrobacteraceae bacterium]